MTITILCATRGRPALFKRLIDSLRARAACGGPKWEVIALVDDDDPKVPEYRATVDCGMHVKYFYCGQHPTISEKFNTQYGLISAPIIGICDDDVVCETDGWNQTVRERAEDDGLWLSAAEGLGEAFFFGPKVPEFFGFITPPHIGHYWAVTWLHEVFAAIHSKMVAVKFVEYPEETDPTHLWLLRDNHSHIAKDGNHYNDGLAAREIQKEELIKLKASLKKNLCLP